jgi:hypothetical protein
MNRFLIGLALAIGITACATPNRLVYSSGFSFANYDYVIVAKPSATDTTTALYGMDIEFANLISRYNMKILGEKEYNTLPQDVQKRTLLARMSLSANRKKILFTVTFDDAVTGRTGSSITSITEGDIFNLDTRTEAFEAISKTIIKALKQDKGLKIQDE